MPRHGIRREPERFELFEQLRIGQTGAFAHFGARLVGRRSIAHLLDQFLVFATEILLLERTAAFCEDVLVSHTAYYPIAIKSNCS
jgi:hypothetical protein